jgi:hypothetical protein
MDKVEMAFSGLHNCLFLAAQARAPHLLGDIAASEVEKPLVRLHLVSALWAASGEVEQ